MRYCFVKQDGIKDCGVACLLMIIRYYKGNASKEYLRDLTHTTKDGTSAYDLMKAGEKFHFTTFGLRGKLEDLKEEYFPVIAHVVKDEVYHHFVVVYKYNKAKGQVVIADPAMGVRKISIRAFQKISTEQFIVFIQNTTILKIYLKHPLYDVLKDFLKQNKIQFISIFCFSFLYMIISIVLTFCLQFFLNYVGSISQINLLFCYYSMIFIVFALLKGILQYIRFSKLIRVTHKFDTCLFQNIYHHLFLLPDSYYENRTTGELLARITDLVDFKNTISKFLLNVAIDSILAILSCIVLLILNPTLTIILLIFVIFDLIIFLLFHKKMKNGVSTLKESYAKFHSYLVDTIESISSIRHMNRCDYVEKKFQLHHQNQLQDSRKYQNCWNVQLLFKNVIHGTSQIVLIVVGCLLIHANKLNLPTFMTYFFLSSFFLNPIESIYEFLLDYQEGKESFQRIEEFYQVEEEEVKKNRKEIQLQSIEVHNLNFFYRCKEQVLINFNNTFLKGEKILIYGKSGCGKSTLIKILAGYLDNYEGKIRINGEELIEDRKQILRSLVTYVSQDESLLNMSLKENIVLGRDISEEKFLEICRILKIHDFVSKNVLTYDMLIEEHGNNLSGGQKQRIILARSILKESDVYILDESLCNMDIALEREILENLFQYLKDKTVIVVSHRFYNEDLYDRKIHLEKGGAYAENYSG